ncbi:MAG: hypothetical protein HFJ59_01355 [Clostridia bacterium]|nr:hypothetical protein [Clostridia bacterium]
MVIKMTNKEEDFYKYMGRFFGSRLVEKQINDRIYDDNEKEWYIYIEEGNAKAFVSINRNRIKNMYTTNLKYLEEILSIIRQEKNITSSIVTNCYLEAYEKCGFKVSQNQNYKNFVEIYSDK